MKNQQLEILVEEEEISGSDSRSDEKFYAERLTQKISGIL